MVKPASVELSADLIEQYKSAMVRVADLRLVVLLVFNAFDEVMKAVAAWRLSCALDDLPKPLTNSASLLFDVVLTDDRSAKKLRLQARQLSELRNQVAHRFPKLEYKTSLAKFVQDISGKRCRASPTAIRQAFVDAVSTLAIDIAVHVSEGVEARGEFPVPMLSFELGDVTRKK